MLTKRFLLTIWPTPCSVTPAPRPGGKRTQRLTELILQSCSVRFAETSALRSPPASHAPPLPVWLILQLEITQWLLLVILTPSSPVLAIVPSSTST
eukprot:COSAG01_NODE_20173_length_967_cov_0.807604_1_plen_95_part_10